MTIKETLKYGCDILEKNGIGEAGIDAWNLFEYITGINRTQYFLYPDKEVDNNQSEKYIEVINKRASHYPLQYITNVQSFLQYDFYVDESVLVPRPETELLVLEAEKLVNKQKSGNYNVCDMCTGSGCIAISFKLRNTDCDVDAVDISDAALHIARRNAADLNADVTFYKSDLFAALSNKRYDLIISNPPYIETAEIDLLMSEVKDYEPKLALDGKEDGLFFYRKIIEESNKYLEPDGKVIFEIGFNQADDITNMLKTAHFKDIQVLKDMSGLNRIVIGGK